MSDLVEYKIRHKCGREFWPDLVYRLHCEPEHKHNYQYQDLMMGTCAPCRDEVFAWVGVDYEGDPVQYEAINHTKHQKWLDRIATDLLRKCDKSACDTVQGSVLDRNSGRYIFRDNIPVY